MAAASTIALVGLGLSAAGASYGAYSSERANSQARRGRRQMQQAQDEASRIQMIERARAAQNEQQQNRPTPGFGQDFDDVLSSDLTGGSARDRLRLSRRTTLGGL